MSLRASERQASAPLLQPAAHAAGTTRPLYSDAIRLRKGVTITGVTSAPTFVNAGRRSFQEPFVPRRALSTHAPNGGLDIDALVASAQTSMRMGHDEVAVALQMKKIKQWFQKKGKQAKDKVKKMLSRKDEDGAAKKAKEAAARKQMMDAGIMPRPAEDSDDDECADGRKPPCTDPNKISVAFDSVGQVHTAASKASKARKKKAAAEKQKEANAALRLARALGAVGESSSESEDDGEFVRRVNGVEQDPNNPVQIPFGNQASFDEVLHEARTMVQQHALEVDGIDLDAADRDTRALHAHMAEAIAHLHVATNGAAWEDDLDVGAPEWWGRHTGWAHEVETGAPAWWERKKDQAKAAMAKAKEAMGKAGAKAKELKNKVANSTVGKMASKAKAAAMKFANEKWERFTNEDRITKMERYDYGLYVSQNPLTDVIIDKKPVTLPAGGDPEAEFYDPHTNEVEGKEPFYGLIATKQKDVLTNAQGDKAFNLVAKDSMKVLSIEKNRELFLAPAPDPAMDMLAQVDTMTLGMKDSGMFMKRALAQGEAQHYAVPDANNTSSMLFPSKPNGAHPLCLGHAMMVPVAEVASAGEHLGLVRAAMSADWLKQVETDLVASPLREGFADMVSAEGADHKPFIIPMPSKYDEKSAAYEEAFGVSGSKPNESMRPVSALLVVPITMDLVNKSGAFKMDGASVDFSYERMYPYQAAPQRLDTRANYSDPAGDRRAELNSKLAEKGPFASENELMAAATELGYDATKPTEAVTWSLSKDAFLQRYQVAVFGLGLAPACDATGEQAACEKNMDQAGTGKLLMISPHPLLMGERHDGAKFDGMEHPGTVYTSHGAGKPLVNALSVALEGKHIDLRFLWAGMKIAQRCWEKATNSRVSKPSLSRFRYLVGQDKEMWQNADKKFNMSGYEKGPSLFAKKESGSFQRRSTGAAFDDDRFSQALEDLGLVHVTTGQQLKLDEMTEDELGQALQLAGIDLDADED